jgi:hypothetical protein
MKARPQGFEIALVLLLVTVAVWSRLLPHPPNFAPIAAAGIFAAAFLPRRWALSVPLASMVVSDLIIGLHPLILFTWGSYLALVLLAARIFQPKVSAPRVISTALLGSIIFFLVTNFGVWLEGRLYPPTLAGLWQSYVMALPFFRNTLLGDLFYTGALFGLYAAALALINIEKSTTIFKRNPS